MEMWRHAAVLFLAMLAPACVPKAPVWTDFQVAESDSSTVIAGRFHASFQDKHRGKKCSVNVSDVWVQFDEWGLVFMNVPPGVVELKKIRCMESSTPYEYELGPYQFVAKPGVVTYFGDLIVQWQTEGGYKIGQMFGLLGALATDPKADPAVVRMQSREAEVKDAFERQTGRKLTWRTELASKASTR